MVGTSPTNTSIAPVRLQVPEGHPSWPGRLVTGLVLTQGLFFGLTQLTLFLLAAAGNDPAWVNSAEAATARTAGQLGVLFLASIVAASGVPRGALLGVVLGPLSMAGFVALDGLLRAWPRQDVIALHVALGGLSGGLGGLLGRAVWRPLPPLPRYDLPGSSSVKIPEVPIAGELGPLIWSRILAGAVLAFVGTVWAQDLRNILGRYARANNGLFDQFVLWQIGSLAVLCGGMFAGANTRRGGMHGTIVAILSSTSLAVAQVSRQIPSFPMHEFWLNQLEIPVPAKGVDFLVVLFGVLNTAGVACLGGWLGSQIIKPRGRLLSSGGARV